MNKADDNIEILIALNNVYSLLNGKVEKKYIKKLIDKRTNDFLVDQNINITSKELGYGKHFINKVFNKKLEYLLNDNYDYNLKIDFHKKNHWLNINKEYLELALIRAQFFKKNESKIKTSALKLLNLYTEQKIENLIIKHFKL
jgi:hypothetical protein